MEDVTKKYPNTPRGVDLKKICLNPNFGDLTFSVSLPILEKMQSDVVELEDLDYKQYLTDSEINQITNAVNTYNNYIQQIQSFTLSQGNPKQTRDNIENSIKSFYQNSFAQQTRNSLIYLRQQVKLDDRTQKDLQQAVVNARKIEKELNDRLSRIKKDEESVSKKAGIVSSKYLSQVFREAAERSQTRVAKWFKAIIIFSILLAIVAGLLFYIYVTSIQASDVNIKTEFTIFSVLLIAISFYILRFCVRNFNVLNHLIESNKHRANVAETLEAFITSGNGDLDIKAALLKEAAPAMFAADSTGYLTKDQMEISSPVQELITTFVSDKK
ncbi:MAG TPA: hypothetical protein VHE10_02750 [Candidatus Paceibacterota bacterium]|nr:hypothetical protein [Candidatus Paceibacterota bacterium]